MDKSFVVVGCGFGDEGKGQTTYALSLLHQEDAVVIRFSGGQQAGHTVTTKDGKKHIFASFGSGTYAEVPTFWSKYALIYPTSWRNEYESLQKENITPKFYYDLDCIVTTPFDVLANQAKSIPGSTVGLGIWETIKRHNSGIQLYARDLAIPWLLERKLIEIAVYYGYAYGYNNKMLPIIHSFIKDCSFMLENSSSEFDINKYSTTIYEGSQGILLDSKYGINPHTTPSRTTDFNARLLLEQSKIKEIYYVSRTYSTRHGNGPLFEEDQNRKVNLSETNLDNKFQGKFRTANLSYELLNYAIDCCSKDYNSRKLVFTCNDIVESDNLDLLQDGLKCIYKSYSSDFTFDDVEIKADY